MRILGFVIAALLAWPAAAQQTWSGSYPEGPVWIGKTLYWAEMYDNRVMTWSGAGAPKPFFQRKGCGPTAIARYREDEIIVLCHIEAALAHLRADGTLIRMIRISKNGHALQDPNDASADGKGGVWFSDPGVFSIIAPRTGAIYHLSPDGELTRHVTGLAYANGVFVDLGTRRLLVSEHLARRVLVYDIRQDDTLGPATTLFHLDDFDLPKPRYREAGPDGLEIGPDGTLWVAEYGAKRLLGWQPGKGLVAALVVDAPYITNIAFGPDGLAAMTGAKNNRVAPFPGATWVFPARALADAIIE